jgi:hypothetical protein
MASDVDLSTVTLLAHVEGYRAAAGAASAAASAAGAPPASLLWTWSEQAGCYLTTLQELHAVLAPGQALTARGYDTWCQSVPETLRKRAQEHTLPGTGRKPRGALDFTGIEAVVSYLFNSAPAPSAELALWHYTLCSLEGMRRATARGLLNNATQHAERAEERPHSPEEADDEQRRADAGAPREQMRLPARASVASRTRRWTTRVALLHCFAEPPRRC